MVRIDVLQEVQLLVRGGDEQKKALEAAKDAAATIFDDPTLRRLLKDVKAASDIRIDFSTNPASFAQSQASPWV